MEIRYRISFSKRECICMHATQTLIIDAEKIWARRGASPSTAEGDERDHVGRGQVFLKFSSN